MRALTMLLFWAYSFTFCMWAQSPPLSDTRIDTLLHTKEIEEITYRSNQFEIVGNLFIPHKGAPPFPLVIWVSGSGPSFRKVKNKETIKLINCFLDNGIAYYRNDKPGSGDSKGKLSDDSVFAQLSDIAIDAVNKLKGDSRIKKDEIGIFGSSQAGYIMPLAITKCSDIAFMIGSSCPGENSIDQWNYLLGSQMICEGSTEQQAKKSVEMFSLLRNTDNKSKFDSAIEYFVRIPLSVSSLGYDSLFSQRARTWWPRTIDLKDEAHLNPVNLFEQIHIPIFLVYGAHDKQIDPLQAIDAYTQALQKAGDHYFKIVFLQDSDHNMSLSTGCLREIGLLTKNERYTLDPEYLRTITRWAEDLNLYVTSKR